MRGKLYINYSRTLVIFTGLVFLLLVLPVIIFTWFFHDYSIGKPIDFANFANYYSGILTPLLTSGSVIALVITLNYQRIQFKDQQKANRLELLLSRFDSAREEFEGIINGPFNHSTEAGALSLNSVFFIKGNVPDDSNELKKAIRIVEILEKVNYEVDTPDEVDAEYGRYFLFITQVKLKGLSLINLYMYFSQFTTSNDIYLIRHLQHIVIDTAHQLATWNMISRKDEASYMSRIAAIEELHKG